MSIATEITRLQTAKANLKTSLEAKGATIASDATIDTYPTVLDDIPVCTLQDKEVSVSGGTTLIEPDQGYTGLHSVSVTAEGGASGDVVFFYDYEGTLVESYTGEEIQALSALPNAPDHSQDEVPLTFDEWNWTLAQIKAYNTSYSDTIINVGAVYHTTDGKNHFYFNIASDTDGNGVEIALQSHSQGDTVDWGDGSAIQTISSTTLTHIYTSVGEYHCIVDSTSTYYNIGGSSTTRRGKREKLTKAYLSNNVTIIASSAFNNCYSLQSITIPSSVTSIGDNAFKSCPLQSITIPSSVTSIGDTAFQYCYNLKLINIPNSVTSLRTSVFYNCYSLQSIAIPSSVTSIGTSAFQYCYNLKSITIPSSVTSIGASAFYNCNSLQSIAISDSVTSIEGNAFTGCSSLQSVTIPNTVTSIGTYAFSNCSSLQSVTIPNTVTSIGTYAFQYCNSLQSITIQSGVTSIGNNAFDSCYALQSVTIPNTVTSIGTHVFANCYSLKSINIPSNVTSIGNYAFKACSSLQSINIQSGVTSIGNNAFYNCDSLQTITIPSSVTSVGSAFDNCYALYSVTVLATTPPTLGTYVFNTAYQRKIYVPYSADHSILAAYQSATNWAEYASIMEELPAS